MGVELHKTARQRPLIAGVVGAALIPVAALVGRFMSATGIGAAICSGGLECILPVVLTAYAAGALLAWGALALLGVRPAWPVALAGSAGSAVVALVIMRLASQAHPAVFVAATAACFALAAQVLRSPGRQPQE